jgi:hypothetical protein
VRGKKLARSNVEYKVGEGIELGLSALTSMGIYNLRGVLHVMFKKLFRHLLRDDTVRHNTTSMTVTYRPNSARILVRFETEAL